MTSDEPSYVYIMLRTTLVLLLHCVTAFQLSGRRMNEEVVLIDGPTPNRMDAFRFAESGSCDDIGWCDQQGCFEENVPARDPAKTSRTSASWKATGRI